MKKKKYPQWYKTVGLKHVTGFLTPTEKQKLKRFAEAADRSLARYVTRLMQQHIKDMEAAEIRRLKDEERRGEVGGRGDGGHGRTDGEKESQGQHDGHGRN